MLMVNLNNMKVSKGAFREGINKGEVAGLTTFTPAF